MSKKVNVKKFLSAINENIILEKFLSSAGCSEAPFLPKDINKKDKEELLMSYYKSLELDQRLTLLEKINIISVTTNKNAVKYIKSYLDSNKYEPLDVTAETITEKAVAFYLEHEIAWDDLYRICKMLSVSGYRRFESIEKNIFDLEGKDFAFKDSITEHLVAVNDAKNILVKTSEFDDNFYTEVTFEDAPEAEESVSDNKVTSKVKRKVKSIYFVYIPKSKMLLLKMSGNQEEQYYYADTYSRNYIDFNLPPSEYCYDLSKFVNNDDSQKPFKNIADVVSWKVLSANLYREVTKDSIAMTFNPKGEGEGMSALEEGMKNFNLKEIGLNLSKIKFEIIVKDENSKKGESKLKVTLQPNKSSLNYLKPEYRILNTILETTRVGEGFKTV